MAAAACEDRPGQSRMCPYLCEPEFCLLQHRDGGAQLHVPGGLRGHGGIGRVEGDAAVPMAKRASDSSDFGRFGMVALAATYRSATAAMLYFDSNAWRQKNFPLRPPRA